jgi:hypothetical protein
MFLIADCGMPIAEWKNRETEEFPFFISELRRTAHCFSFRNPHSAIKEIPQSEVGIKNFSLWVQKMI